jgi:hypothetical protein
MSIVFREESIRARNFQFLHCDEADGIETDIYVSTDGAEIKICYDDSGLADFSGFFFPNMPDPSAVEKASGGMMTPEEIETLAFEILDDDPRILERLTGLVDQPAEESEEEFSLG